MDALQETRRPEALMAVNVDPGVDALQCTGVGKRFTASMGKKDKEALAPPANRMAALWRRLKPPRRIKHAVDNVTLKLRRGEIFGVVGHNGSGKSTLIRMISTLLTPDEGSISVFGYDPQTSPYAVQRLINRVSVDAAFFKKLSANENLLYAARLYGVDDKYALRRAQEILEILGLEEGRMTDSLQELSRGMQQKVAVARALLTSPILLLLDEPTTGLDPKSKRDVQDFILELQRTHDATVLLTSHDMDEVERLCGRIALMSDGRFVARGTADELKQQVLTRRIERGEAQRGDQLPTMEDVFIELTGQEWLSAEEDVD